MSRDEAEAVLAHEISHVANGDMVTLTLIQGVVITFVVFFSKLFGIFVDSMLRKDGEERGPGIGSFIAEIVAQLVLGVLASIIVMWFSRHREFRADAGGAALAGREKMIAALERLKINHRAGFSATGDGCIRHIRRHWHEPIVHDPSAAGRAHRRLARRTLGLFPRSPTALPD